MRTMHIMVLTLNTTERRAILAENRGTIPVLEAFPSVNGYIIPETVAALVESGLMFHARAALERALERDQPPYPVWCLRSF